MSDLAETTAGALSHQNVVGHITHRPTVVGTGLVALDVVYGLNRACAPGLYAGGTCGNVLAALAFLGWESYPVARLAADAAGARVLADLRAAGVHTDFAAMAPRRPTPIIIQRMSVDSDGRVVHRFTTRCPGCGAFFPQYQPVPRAPMGEMISAAPVADVVFLDRVSPAAVLLAEEAYERSALIYFEPSAKCEARLVDRMLEVTHILKYSSDRVRHFDRPDRARVPLEIETRGAAGLRYRGTMFGLHGRSWRTLAGFLVPELRDAAGAGDWMTAGLLDFLGQAGAAGFDGLPRDVIEDGLRTGQAFSAWACGFEGARSGMYRQDSATVRLIVAKTLSGSRVRVRVTDESAESNSRVLGDLCAICTYQEAGMRA